MWFVLPLILVLVGCAADSIQPYGYFEARQNLGLDRASCDQTCQSRIVQERERRPYPMGSTAQPLSYPSLSSGWQMLRTPSGALFHNYGGGMIQGPRGEIYTVY